MGARDQVSGIFIRTHQNGTWCRVIREREGIWHYFAALRDTETDGEKATLTQAQAAADAAAHPDCTGHGCSIWLEK